MTKDKDYLGDGIYTDTDGYHLILTTESGMTMDNGAPISDNIIFIDPYVAIALQKKLEQFLERRKPE
jgi:hypothetical protein